MARYRLFILFAGLVVAGMGLAQEPTGIGSDTVTADTVYVPRDVFALLGQRDSLSSATVAVCQDTLISQLFIDRQLVSRHVVISGFRVQVFSSNRQQTAKAEAFRIKDLVLSKFPEKRVYESYSSPFWKVRVGDFRTREEAHVLLEELRAAFPDMRREMYVVPDDITVAGSK